MSTTADEDLGWWHRGGFQHLCAVTVFAGFVAVMSFSAGGWRLIFSAGTSPDKCTHVDRGYPEGKERFESVCLGGGTERPFSGLYDHEPDEIPKDGVYRCACCGAPLYPVSTQFKSGTGWPSFWAPIANGVSYGKDIKQLFSVELSCSMCGAHLGHVFDDGVGETGHRHCINSVCLHHDNSTHLGPTLDVPWVPNSLLMLALVVGGGVSTALLCCFGCSCLRRAVSSKQEGEGSRWAEQRESRQAHPLP
jgi:peptide-methionine (R)-S-oxide reductase